jgi:hypothetical protein
MEQRDVAKVAVGRVFSDGMLPTCNFPSANFALAGYWLVNAKVGESTLFKCATALSFLEKVGILQNDNGTWRSCQGMEEKSSSWIFLFWAT